MFKRHSQSPASASSFNLITVSGTALRHNYMLLAKLTDCDIFPVLKGNAYGHGIEIVAEALKSVRAPYLAVNGYDEAERIWSVAPRQPVLVMGTLPPAAYQHADRRRTAYVIHDLASLAALAARRQTARIHLEVNTGMNRYGVEPADLSHFLAALKRHPHIQLEGVMSHLADADGPLPATVTAATNRFDWAVEQIRAAGFKPLHLHVANSAGAVTAHSGYATGVRAGLALYGINPLPPNHPGYVTLADLRPALAFTSAITDVHMLEAGDQVSYNYTFTAPGPMRLGVLPAGYYEGVNRALSNSGRLGVKSAFVPVVGRVCMNHTMINLGETKAQIGDSVTVISDNPADPNSISSLAAAHGLFNYNLLTALAADVPRRLLP